MKNVIELIKRDMERHTITVTLPGERKERKMYLIITNAKTSKLEDFKKTYGKKATKTHLKLATKIFGEKETENSYGTLLDSDFRIIFAFNMDFAEYRPIQKNIYYRDIEDVIIEAVKKNIESGNFPQLPPLSPNQTRIPNGRGGGGNFVVKYSLTEKKEEKNGG
jgi:uncharacterized membrane protein YvbJ